MDQTKTMTTKLLPPHTPSGQGWGDGSLVRQFNRKRKINPENSYTGFRPRVGEIEGAYFVIRNWCNDPRVNKSFSAIFNSLMVSIKVACEHTTEIDADGQVSIELNLGRIVIA